MLTPFRQKRNREDHSIFNGAKHVLWRSYLSRLDEPLLGIRWFLLRSKWPLLPPSELLFSSDRFSLSSLRSLWPFLVFGFCFASASLTSAFSLFLSFFLSLVLCFLRFLCVKGLAELLAPLLRTSVPPCLRGRF